MPLTPAEVAQANKLSQREPWLLMFEVEVPTAPPTRYRFVKNTESVEFGQSSAGVPIPYYPFDFDVEPIKEDNQGSGADVRVTFQNVTREAQASLEAYDDLVGQPCRVLLVHRSLLNSGVAAFDWKGKVLQTDSGESTVVVTAGVFSLYRRQFPPHRALRGRCRHVYAGPLCQYGVPSGDPNYLATCDFTYDGTNGCTVHGDSESAAGVEVKHPKLFGGFRGIPRRTGLGA